MHYLLFRPVLWPKCWLITKLIKERSLVAQYRMAAVAWEALSIAGLHRCVCVVPTASTCTGMCVSNHPAQQYLAPQALGGGALCSSYYQAPVALRQGMAQKDTQPQKERRHQVRSTTTAGSQVATSRLRGHVVPDHLPNLVSYDKMTHLVYYGKAVDIVYLDFSKVFDTWRNCLLMAWMNILFAW